MGGTEKVGGGEVDVSRIRTAHHTKMKFSPQKQFLVNRILRRWLGVRLHENLITSGSYLFFPGSDKNRSTKKSDQKTNIIARNFV